MRLDKYLKVSRVIKRRTVAKEVCSGGRVDVNGRVAKAGTEVEPGDTITIHFGKRTLEIRVLATPAVVRAEEAQGIYEVLSNEENKDELI